MNLRASCVNKQCAVFDIQKSVMVGQLLGYGAPNDRVICPACGQLMRTTKSINVSKGKSMRKFIGRNSSRQSPSRHRPKRTVKRLYKRGGGKRF